jgi:hypothetical protein
MSLPAIAAPSHRRTSLRGYRLERHERQCRAERGFGGDIEPVDGAEAARFGVDDEATRLGEHRPESWDEDVPLIAGGGDRQLAVRRPKMRRRNADGGM